MLNELSYQIKKLRKMFVVMDDPASKFELLRTAYLHELSKTDGQVAVATLRASYLAEFEFLLDMM